MANVRSGLVNWSTSSGMKGARSSRMGVFQSKKSKMTASDSLEVIVDLKLDANDIDMDAILRDFQAAIERTVLATDVRTMVKTTKAALRDAIALHLRDDLTEELEGMVDAYRNMLERSLPSGQDETITRALKRVKLRTEVLSSVPMVDQAQACALLNLSDANPSATLGRYEAKGRILRYDLRGKAAYPLFQFDEAEGRIHPTLLKIMEMRSDNWGGKLALLHWLTRPNRNLGGARPCDRLATDGDAILRSFDAELAEPLNG